MENGKWEAESGKWKTEICVFPHPNQVILLREMQKVVCKKLNQEKFTVIQCIPLCLKCPNLTDLTVKITKADIDSIKEDVFSDKKIIYLAVNLEINGIAATGRIELCEIDEENLTKEAQESFSAEAILSQEEIPFKKLSPFRIVEMNSEEYENGVHWEITAEKWGKVK